VKTQFSPPYYAALSFGHWYVLNSRGGYELACDSREQCLLYVAAMNQQVKLSENKEHQDRANA